MNDEKKYRRDRAIAFVVFHTLWYGCTLDAFVRNFGHLFASRETFAIMVNMAKCKQNKYLRRYPFGGRPVTLDLRLLTTTTSKGI